MKVLQSILTKGWVNAFADPTFEEFGEMSELDQRYYVFGEHRTAPSRHQYNVYYKDNGNLVIAERHLTWTFRGDKFFIKSDGSIVQATIFPSGKIIGNVTRAAEIVANLLGGYVESRSVTRAELKALLVEGIPGYKREYEKAEIKREIHRWGLYASALPHITTNADVIMELISKPEYHELKDLLQQAIILKRVVKHTWSARKVHDMHMRWTREIADLACRNVPDTPIWDPEYIPNLPKFITLINSERDAVQEGTKMHHCLGTNYRGRIARKNYVAFHVSDPEGDYTVGITLSEKCELEQARKVCNNSCSEEQLEIANALVEFAQDMYNAHVKSKDFNTVSDYDLQRTRMPF
jgi:hypothetical protein